VARSGGCNQLKLATIPPQPVEVWRDELGEGKREFFARVDSGAVQLRIVGTLGKVIEQTLNAGWCKTFKIKSNQHIASVSARSLTSTPAMIRYRATD